MNAIIATDLPEDKAMALQPKFEPEGISMTEEEYLKTEPASEVKREFIDGHAYAMSGASNNHARITANILGEFRNHLKGQPCEAFMSDIKVKSGQNYFYPDITVDCSNPSGVDYFANSPVIIVEVLSKSTRKFDTSIKLLKYINIPTLKEYVLVEQDVVSIEVLRKSNEWRTEYYSLGDSITFEAIELTLTVEEIYDRVDNREINEFRQAKLDLENPGLTKS